MRMLKRHRLARGLSLKEIGTRLRVHTSTVGAWETGRNLPRPHLVPKLARILEIDPLELTRVMEPEPPQQPAKLAS